MGLSIHELGTLEAHRNEAHEAHIGEVRKLNSTLIKEGKT